MVSCINNERLQKTKKRMKTATRVEKHYISNNTTNQICNKQTSESKKWFMNQLDVANR